MSTDNETIAAISTPPGMGAIAVVRISGEKAILIAESIFSAAKTPTKTSFTSREARHGYIIDPASEEVLDEVVVTAFAAPRTYTGEDMVEVSCHGGMIAKSEILALALKMGARLALPGEFTKRAFLAGRIDLTQAEAVLDLIQAKTGRQGRLALSALSGGLGAEISRVRAQLLALTTRVVAGIDFPEEVGDLPPVEIKPVVDQCHKVLSDLARTARSGRFLREGLRLSIVGRPNAGKSSLLNQLIKFERAIVTEIPGTTRDSLEELVDLNGIPVVLVDTAGIRPTDDRVELIGIERTRQSIFASDLVVLLVDLTCGWGEPEDEIVTITAGRPLLIAANKIDICPASIAPQLNGNDKHDNLVGQVRLSATTGEGINDFTQAVESWVFAGASRESAAASLNQRQADICLKAVKSLELAQESLSSEMPEDCLVTDLKGTLDALSEMCGEEVSAEVIDQVFANFCIGK